MTALLFQMGIMDNMNSSSFPDNLSYIIFTQILCSLIVIKRRSLRN